MEIRKNSIKDEAFELINLTKEDLRDKILLKIYTNFFENIEFFSKFSKETISHTIGYIKQTQHLY